MASGVFSATTALSSINIFSILPEVLATNFSGGI